MVGGILLCIGMVLSAVSVNIIQVYVTLGAVAGKTYKLYIFHLQLLFITNCC